MLFQDSVFIVFLIIVFGLWALTHKWNYISKTILLIASYVFYGAWNVKYIWLILASTLIDYVVGIILSNLKQEQKLKRNLALAASIVTNKNSKISEAVSHKLHLWKKLYALHCNSNIFLIICKPAYHNSWDFHYKNKYDNKVYELETFFKTNGVPIIDCTTINIKDSECHDAHHFTWSGAAKISTLVGTKLSEILNKKYITNEKVCLSGKKISEIN